MLGLCPHIFLFQIPDTDPGKQQEEYAQTDQKRKQSLPQGILRLVGVHAKQHDGIGPVHTVALIADNETQDTARQRDSDRNRKAADHHR